MNNSLHSILRLSRLIRPLALIALCATLLTAFTYSYAQTRLPAQVDQALKEAEAVSDLKLNFTMTFRWQGVEDIVQRYDAALEEWIPISGDPSNLNSAGRRKLQAYKKYESAPGGLVYADYRDHIKNVTLVDEAETINQYSFISPRTPDIVKGSEEHVVSRLLLDNDEGGLTKYSIEAKQPFRPNPMSKLEEFAFSQTFDRLLPDTPPLMTSLHWRAKGTRLFTSVDEEFSIFFSDFENVEK